MGQNATRGKRRRVVAGPDGRICLSELARALLLLYHESLGTSATRRAARDRERCRCSAPASASDDNLGVGDRSVAADIQRTDRRYIELLKQGRAANHAFLSAMS
jgi:hypothetical protein